MIKVNNLQFTYPKQEEATVRGINFEIAKGEIFGFLGPSGAGKSTTQKVLIRLLRPFGGEVTVLDKPLQNWDASYYNHVGVGFELPNHYKKLTGVENLRFFASFYDKPCENPEKLLSMVGLSDAKDKRVADYSKGMKMRLNFVRALMHDPEILFFDEPTSGLDPVNARIMKDIILERKAAGKTVFITTHKMNDADELCDRIAFIVNGKIVLIDSPQALKLQHGKRKVEVTFGENGRLQTQQFPMDDLGGNKDFLELLNGQYIQSIHSKEATLDDIFIKLTGQSLTANHE